MDDDNAEITLVGSDSAERQPGLIAWLLGVSPIASTALAAVVMVCVVLAAGMLSPD
ncbi:hypothetical protein [Prescottella equi]